jgi:hypothetical protein
MILNSYCFKFCKIFNNGIWICNLKSTYQIISAQKEKIEALTAYGKKLKKQIKDAKELIDDNCQDLIDAFQVETLNTERSHQKVLILSIIATLLIGIAIGMRI